MHAGQLSPGTLYSTAAIAAGKDKEMLGFIASSIKFVLASPVKYVLPLAMIVVRIPLLTHAALLPAFASVGDAINPCCCAPGDDVFT